MLHDQIAAATAAAEKPTTMIQKRSLARDMAGMSAA
jgi:hypothetical protein